MAPLRRRPAPRAELPPALLASGSVARWRWAAPAWRLRVVVLRRLQGALLPLLSHSAGPSLIRSAGCLPGRGGVAILVPIARPLALESALPWRARRCLGAARRGAGLIGGPGQA